MQGPFDSRLGLSQGWQSTAESALGAWNTNDAVIRLDCHPQCPSCRLEDRFTYMVTIPSVVDNHVEVAEQVGSKRLAEIFDELTIEVTNGWSRKFCSKAKCVTTAQINGNSRQSFLHRKGEVSVSTYSGFVAKRFFHRLSQANPHIFDGMMLVDMQIPVGGKREINATVLGQKREHMIQKANVGLDIGAAVPVEVYGDLDLCLLSLTVCGGDSGHGGVWGFGMPEPNMRLGPSRLGAILYRYISSAILLPLLFLHPEMSAFRPEAGAAKWGIPPQLLKKFGPGVAVFRVFT